jgi:hypothetical protein
MKQATNIASSVNSLHHDSQDKLLLRLGKKREVYRRLNTCWRLAE